MIDAWAVTIGPRDPVTRGALAACLLTTVAGLACDGDGEKPLLPATPVVLPCTPLPPIQHLVRRQGAELRLGDQRFRTVGGNVYYLQQLFTYGDLMGPSMSQPALDALDAVSCLSMNVVRTMGFNDGDDVAAIRRAPGQYDEHGLARLDRAVAEAKARGLRLILTLTNNWADYGGLEPTPAGPASRTTISSAMPR